MRLSLSAPAAALGRGGIGVRLDGKTLDPITRSGRQDVTFRLPARPPGAGLVARLEFTARGMEAVGDRGRQPGRAGS